MDQEFKARAGSEREAYKSIVNQVHAYLRRTSRTKHYWEIQRTEWKPTELFGGGELKAHVWIKDSKMTKNSLMKFIDSCVGNIARKIEDEFKESDHPRDKGGKFTSKGGEGRGGASKKTKAHEPPVEETEFEKSAKEELNGKKGNVITTSMEFTGDEEDAKQLAKKYGFDYKLKYPKGSPYATIEMTGDKDALRKYAVNEGFGSEEDAREFAPELFEESEEDDEGYMGVSKEELAEEEEYENARERARREKDDDRVTGPEDRDYMNEEDDDDDTTNSAAKDVKSMRQHLDEELFELATTSESEEEFKSKVKRKFDQYRWLLKNGHQDELPVGGKRAEYALKKIQSEIDSGTSEYW